MDTDKAIVKIYQLLALSKQENIHEASTAALAAVRMIEKYGFEIIIPKSSYIEPTKEKKKKENVSIEASVITARYNGFCKDCRKKYNIGETVYWKPGIGCWHMDCDLSKNGRSRK